MDGGGGMGSMGRPSAHPPMSGGGGPLASGTSISSQSSNLPTMKQTSSSSYQTGTKYHSFHATATMTGEVPFNSSHVKSSSSTSDNEAPAIDSPVQFLRHRNHRRPKDQETLLKSNSSPLPPIRESNLTNNSQYNRGVQFDLEAAAFPPLPGLETADAAKLHDASTEPQTVESTQSHWENRLSDVVKGTAKLKSTKDNKDPPVGGGQYHQQQTSNSSRSASPGSSAGGNSDITSPGTSSTQGNSTTSNSNSSTSNNDSTDIALSTITLTPPSSPDK